MSASSKPALAPARRPPGRPKGSKTRVLRHDGALGVHHFAFLRATLQRLDLREAWARYLAFSDLNDDVRHIEHRRVELLARVLTAGHQLDLTLPADRRITAQLALLAQPPLPANAVALPSLDEFIDAQGIDREFHSESELLALYREQYREHLREHFHLDTVAEDAASLHASAGSLAQVRALNQVEALLARTPEGSDRLDLWLSPALASRLKAAGIASLGALADTVRVYGHGWYRRVRGLGPTRARAIVDWLSPLAEAFGHPIPEAARQPPQRQRAMRASTLRNLVIPARFGIVPLEHLAVPPGLSGGSSAPGKFATRMPNHLGATDDLQAIRGWLATYQETKPTHRAYAKEAERFYLWCLQVRGKPLSSVDSIDCLAYRQFLADVPADWINPVPCPRGDPAWRPFRGALSPASQKYALVVVQAMFDGLAAANWLVGNPMRAVSKKAKAPPGATPLERSFTEAEWVFIGAQVRRMLDGDATGSGQRTAAEARRIGLLLEMLAATGLRLAEIAGATLDDIAQVSVDGEVEPARVIRVLGKGNKRREVPVPDEVIDLIAQHHRDARQFGALPSSMPMPMPTPAPIVCTLGERPRRWVDRADGSVALEGRGAAEVRALSASGIYQVLKRFFRRISRDAHAVDGLSGERLLAASTHWLRHTFGRQGAAAGVPVEVLRQAFGHASLATTSLYLNTERSRMITELRKMRREKAG